LGNFKVKFESYIPTETYLCYQSSISVLSNAGDSIYLVIDGSKKNDVDILESIKFSGDNKQVNREYSQFLQLFFKNRIDEDFRYEKIIDLSPSQYIKFEDSLKNENFKLFNNFSSNKILKEETKVWISSFIENQYYYPVNFYPYYHGMLNNLNQSEWNAPIEYYSFLEERLPLTESDFVSSDAFATYINCYSAYIYKITMQEQEKVHGNSWLEKMTENELDSIIVHSIIEHTYDNLLKQLLLSEFFNNKLENSKAYTIEKFQPIIIKNITEPCLIEPMLREYKLVKETNENPILSPDLKIIEIDSYNLENIFDTILFQNKNKIILIDCWATWCSPCLSEFPYSNELITKMKDKDIEFVFICLQSKEDAWKAKLSRYNLTGKHYFLDASQSDEFMSKFSINGFPYYFLIGKSGEIIDKGSHLRPSDKSTTEKINSLLRKNVP